MGTSPAVRIENLTWTYEGAEKPALKGINLTIQPGEVVLIAGPNGSGRTTLCRLLNGLIPHFFDGKMTGNVFINGINTREATIGHLSQIAGLVFDDPLSQLVNPTVFDEIAFGPENVGVPADEIRKRIKESLEFVRLAGYEERAPYTLSGGEQQSLCIASIIAMRPQIYVLDEPTSNLDPIGSERVFRVIARLAQEEKKTVIIVSHSTEELVSLVSRVIVINEGQVALDGDPRSVFANAEYLLKARIAIPQVTELFEKLKHLPKFKVSNLPITLDEAYAKLKELGFENSAEAAPPAKGYEEEKSDEVTVEADHVGFSYPESQAKALDDVNMKVHKGDFLAVIGQNGSGKTTLVKNIVALLKPTEGVLHVGGVDVRNVKTWQLADKVGIVFQNPDIQLFSESVVKEIAFGTKAMGFTPEKANERMAYVADRFGLKDLMNESPGEVDKGTRQKIAIAAVVVLDPQTLIIDEPTTGQDPDSARQIMNIASQMNKDGKSIIMITHSMPLVAEYAKKVMVLSDGHVLFQGLVKDVYQRTEMLKKASLKPPQIIQLALLLKIPQTILSIDDMYSYLVKRAGA
jgi:energy-coupling factor transporter ATP-binding protein EcfA2